MSASCLYNAGCPVRSAFCMRATVHARTGCVTLHNHTLTGLTASATTAPLYANVAAAGEDPEGEEDAVEVEDGQVGADGWRRTYRKLTPAKNPPAWAYMKQCFQNQRRAGVALTERRLSFSQRAEAKLASAQVEKDIQR